MSSSIRESPYEPGLYFVDPEPGTTLQSIGSQQWQVGTRYKLEKVLGYGSFSCVCLALDTRTGKKVALKRIGDVLQSPDQAKRVLREISILRRLRHPNIIAVYDCFLRPSATGQCRLIGGKLVSLSVDLYIAMEFADGGDLFNLRGQLSAQEVKHLMWQLLRCLRYVHTLHVWHRDVKSQNIFLTRLPGSGMRVPKLGDFGSARSACPEGYHWAEQAPSHELEPISLVASRKRPIMSAESDDGPALHPSDSYQRMAERVRTGDLYVQYQRTSNAFGGSAVSGYRAPLTRLVATPCYRAPEVVMSRGGYSSGIDMWSMGCIFGELLQRVSHVGSAATPALQIAPLFAIRGLPRTPDEGDSFQLDDASSRMSTVQAGTVECSVTRQELQALFDVIGTPPWADLETVQSEAWRHYLGRLPGKAPTLFRRFATAGECAVDLLSRLLAFDPKRRCSAEEALAHEYFADVDVEEMERLLGLEEVEHGAVGDEHPGMALARLEEELSQNEPGGIAAAGSQRCIRLRELLEAEVAAISSQAGALLCSACGADRTTSASPLVIDNAIITDAPGTAEKLQKLPPARPCSSCGLREAPPRAPTPPASSLASLALSQPFHAGQDPGPHRLSNVADTWQGSLDPEKYLDPFRHYGWTELCGQGPRDGPTWGVTAVPPGVDPEDMPASMAAIIKAQQGR